MTDHARDERFGEVAELEAERCRPTPTWGRTRAGADPAAAGRRALLAASAPMYSARTAERRLELHSALRGFSYPPRP